MSASNCPKCGSSESIPNVRIIDHTDANLPLDLCATIYTKPDAWVFKRPVSHRFQARVCGSCGYTEFYVDDPRGLLAIAGQVGSER